MFHENAMPQNVKVAEQSILDFMIFFGPYRKIYISLSDLTIDRLERGAQASRAPGTPDFFWHSWFHTAKSNRGITGGRHGRACIRLIDAVFPLCHQTFTATPHLCMSFAYLHVKGDQFECPRGDLGVGESHQKIFSPFHKPPTPSKS